jgi:hypothetical protein
VIAPHKADLVDDDWLALVEDDVRCRGARSPRLASFRRRCGWRGIDELRSALASLAPSVRARPE